MNVIVTCPNCQRELETDDGVGRLQCPCGTMLQIPKSEGSVSGGGDGTRCPGCGADVDAGAVLCVSCGYNLKTGQTLGTEVGDAPDDDGSVLDSAEDDDFDDADDVDVVSKFKPLIKLGAVVVLVLIGVGLYIAANAKHFGIKGDTPLGTAAEVEAYCKEIGLVPKGEKTTDEQGNTSFTYWDQELFTQTKKSSNQWVTVHADSSGKVLAIMATYDGTDMGPIGGRTCGFIRTFWNDIGGDVKEKSIKTDTLHAKWTQGIEQVGLNEFTTDTLGVSLPGLTYVKAIDTFCTHSENHGEVMMAP